VSDARQEAALEEVVDNLQEALQNIKTTLEVLTLAEMGDHSDSQDLFQRVFAARAMTQAAYVEARRRTRTHRGGSRLIRGKPVAGDARRNDSFLEVRFL